MMPVPKTETRLSVRIRPDLKADLERLADWNGLTVSSYVQSLLIRGIRREKELTPEIFQELKEEMIHGRELSPTSEEGIPLHRPEQRKKDAA